MKKLLCFINIITFVGGSFGPHQEKWPNNAQCTLSLIRDGVTLSDRKKESIKSHLVSLSLSLSLSDTKKSHYLLFQK